MSKQKRPAAHLRAQRLGKELDGYVCAFCGKATYEVQGHHLIPYCEGGEATADNIIALCPECHKAYHAGEIDVDIIRY